MVERRRLAIVIGEVTSGSVNPTDYGGVDSFYRAVHGGRWESGWWDGWGANLCEFCRRRETVGGSESLLLRVLTK